MPHANRVALDRGVLGSAHRSTLRTVETGTEQSVVRGDTRYPSRYHGCTGQAGRAPAPAAIPS
jgi:hypothetical protein